MTTMKKSIKFDGKVKRKGNALEVSVLGALPEEIREDVVYDITIREKKQVRTIPQNALMWWTYRKESEILNAGYKGEEGVDPWELYNQDLLRMGDAILVDVIPEAIEELKRVFRVVVPLGAVEHDGKTYIRCDCRTGSSEWDKDKMAKWLEYRIRRLESLGYKFDMQNVIDEIKNEWEV